MGRKSRRKDASPRIDGRRREDAEPAARTAGARGWAIAFLVLCTVGACLSTDLLRLHVNVHTDPEYHSYCAMSARVNCDTVAASDYSVFLGLPVALWGLAGYLFLGVLAIWGIARSRRGPAWPFGLLLVVGIALSVLSVGLYLLSHFVIESVCIVCGGTYLVNLGLAWTAWMASRRSAGGAGAAVAADLRSLRRAPGSFALAVTVLAAVLIAARVTVPAYWKIEAATGPGGLPVGVTTEGHPWIGARQPSLVITEFSDYQCPHCQRGHDEMRRLIEQYPERVRLVHRSFPLDHHCNAAVPRPFHPHACDYAAMALCALRQNRFWEANDYLFAHGRERVVVAPDDLARAIDVDVDELRACMGGAEVGAEVQADLQAGRALNVRGTPTFVIGDQIYPGRVPPDVLRDALGVPAPGNPAGPRPPQ